MMTIALAYFFLLAWFPALWGAAFSLALNMSPLHWRSPRPLSSDKRGYQK